MQPQIGFIGGEEAFLKNRERDGFEIEREGQQVEHGTVQ